MFSLLNKKIIILERYLEGFFMENCEKIILDNIETLINICSKLTDFFEGNYLNFEGPGLFFANNVDNKNIENYKSKTYSIKDSLLIVAKKLKNVFCSLSSSEVSKQFRNLLSKYSEYIKSNTDNLSAELIQMSRNGDNRRMVENLTQTTKIIVSEGKRVILMSYMAKVHSNIIIVGKNGSGKTTLVNSLFSPFLDNITVIPAQKVLHFDIRLLGQNYNIEKYQENDLKPVNNDFKDETKYINEIASPFTAMISALANDDIYIGQLDRQKADENKSKIKRTESKLDKVKEVWKEIIPEITLKISGTQDTHLLAIKKENNEYSEYSINSMSDGEKCILFYIGNIILAKKESYIVVDEPETFLNPASYNKLWDKLIEERPDCQFIFTSHNPDFITARENTTLIWCKKFTLGNEHIVAEPELEILNDTNKLSNEIPIELITELVGSRKRILFCEGTKESYDYRIYSKVYKEYTVKPVGGHDKVIQYTKTFNELPQWIENSAVGIIDNDGMSMTEEKRLKKDKIFCLPYNEIEMLLFDERLIFWVLKDIKFPDDNQNQEINNEIDEFKSEFISIIQNRKEQVIYDIVKTRIDYKLRTEFIDSNQYNTIKKLETCISEIPEKLDVISLDKNVSERVIKAIREKNYSELLKVCTLKNEVSKGIANKVFCCNYVMHAIARISVNKEIKDYLRKRINLR